MTEDVKDNLLVPDEFRLAWGKHIRATRKAADLTLQALSEASGVSMGQLSRIERGEAAISDHHICGLASALGVEPMQLVPDGASDAEVVLVRAVRTGDARAALRALAALLDTTTADLCSLAPRGPTDMHAIQLAGVGQASIALAAQIAQALAASPSDAATLVSEWMAVHRDR